MLVGSKFLYVIEFALLVHHDVLGFGITLVAVCYVLPGLPRTTGKPAMIGIRVSSGPKSFADPGEPAPGRSPSLTQVSHARQAGRDSVPAPGTGRAGAEAEVRVRASRWYEHQEALR